MGRRTKEGRQGEIKGGEGSKGEGERRERTGSGTGMRTGERGN
jgi:hypothetical protein